MTFLDRWREILAVLWRRKLRTLLTALSVAWGIFMLVVLLAAGKGLANGAEREFSRDALNSVRMNPGRLTKPHNGNPIGKVVALRNDDFALVKTTLPGVDRASARYGTGDQVVRVGPRHERYSLRGVHPDHAHVEKSDIIAGRFINDMDIEEVRKVAVIGKKVRDTLFERGADPIGAVMQAGVVNYTVVGVLDEVDDENEQETIYVPISTAQAVYGGTDRVYQIVVTLDSAKAGGGTAFTESVRTLLSRRHGFAPDDKRALWIWNSQEMWERLNGLFNGIRFFVWVIGLGTILAGVVGVGNIMLISVQERIREIGLRKAIGAQPFSIVLMIVEEAVVITLVSGYLGLVAAVAVIEAVSRSLPPTPFFRNPEIDIGVGLAATFVLMIAGVLAGFFPAVRAARVNPITALRVE